MTHPESMFPTLYAPADMAQEKLLRKMEGHDPLVHRFVIDTEDAVTESHLDEALANLGRTLDAYQQSDDTDVFVRLRNPEVTERVLAMDGVAKLRGFVIPKATPETFGDRVDQISQHGKDFRLMPLLEAPGMNDYGFRRDLRQVFSTPEHRAQIDCLRIGVNDLMSNLAMRRPETMTIYETIIGKLISDIVIEFRGIGHFDITAPLFECFGEQYDPVLQKELQQHVANQLFGQVVLHPRQLPKIWEAYKVTAKDLEDAESVMMPDAKAAVGQGGRLVSTKTHTEWAGTVLLRAEMFGVKDADQSTRQ